MFVPAHRVEGQLIASLTVAALSMEIDLPAATALSAAIGTSDHTYLMLDVGGTTKEVVKVTSVSGTTVNIDRGEDGTMALGFPATTPVKYVFATPAIVDVAKGDPITITGTGDVIVTQSSPTDFEVNYAMPTITSMEGTIAVQQSGNYLILEVIPSSLGCCDSSISPGH